MAIAPARTLGADPERPARVSRDRSVGRGRRTLRSLSASITVQTRKRLWGRSGNRCAYPGCTLALLTPTAAGNNDTVIGKECHIVAQTDDDPSVARSPCLLTDEEKRQWAHLIEHRHSYENLVLMCGVQSPTLSEGATPVPPPTSATQGAGLRARAPVRRTGRRRGARRPGEPDILARPRGRSGSDPKAHQAAPRRYLKTGLSLA